MGKLYGKGGVPRFIAAFMWAVGTIGGFGLAAYNREWIIAACVAVLGALAFPTIRRFFKEMQDGE